MGHDISGFNKAGKEVCYMRFSMGNYTSYVFYDFFDANDCHGGVSGLGRVVTYSVPQIKKAMKAYEQFCKEHPIRNSDADFLTWERNEMFKFIRACMNTAENEGSVSIAFA